MRQKWSMPSIIVRVENAAIGSTIAPACSKSLAAATTAARTSDSTANPQPASSCRPSFRPLTSRASVSQSKR